MKYNSYTNRFFVNIASFLALLVVTSCTPKPKVIATNPSNGANDVDQNTTLISVTFDKQMVDKSWSWVQEAKDTFPELAGQPYYDAERRTNFLPVKLTQGKTYTVWINSKDHKNFKDQNGSAAEPFKLTFTTKN